MSQGIIIIMTGVLRPRPGGPGIGCSRSLPPGMKRRNKGGVFFFRQKSGRLSNDDSRLGFEGFYMCDNKMDGTYKELDPVFPTVYRDMQTNALSLHLVRHR